MIIKRKKTGDRIKNISKQQPINKSEAKTIANREISLRTFNPDYDMVLKRVSKAVNGLKCGAPPPTVT